MTSAWFIALLALLIATPGCDRNGPKQTAPTPKTSSAKAASKTNEPKRIVSLAPSVTETLFALGVGPHVVGVTRFCDYPPAATKLPHVGGLTDVDVETVISLKPDLVVGVQSHTAKALTRTLDDAGIRNLFVPVETFDDVATSFETIGRRVGAPKQGKALARALRSHTVKARADAPTVLVLFGRKPWIAAGPNTFADEMIRRAGGRNVLAELKAKYPKLDVEKMQTLHPDVVIDTSIGGGRGARKIPVASKAIVVRLDPALMRPGPRLGQALDRFAAAIAQGHR